MTALPAALLPTLPDHALAAIQADFLRDWNGLLQAARAGQLEPVADRRFAAPAWQGDYRWLAQVYLLSAQTMLRMTDALTGDAASRARVRFAVQQWVDALAPSNFLAANPEAQQALLASGGATLQAGLANLLADVQKGRISQCDENHFAVGRNIAVTPGSVVFENRLLQLIQYAPTTATVYQRPLLIVPPCINKFYVLDLQPENSFVRHAVAAGHRVLMVSWRNPLPADGDGIGAARWDDYVVEGVLQALAVAREITGQPQVNVLGFCVGGTLLACALAVAQARGESPAASLTLLASMLDFRDTGALSVFVDEWHARLREQTIGQGGLMTARELATTFSFLRPNELVWNYVVANYLKGETPAAFDLLYWNSDGTNLPGPFFAWYFRHTYLENNLKVPGRVRIAGHAIDLSRLTMPTYLFGSREDHIVPWQTAYASAQVLGGSCRFVLGASGHIAGVINPPAKQRRCYWRGDADTPLPTDPQAWLASAQTCPGSWWDDWTRWLGAHGGRKRRVAKTSTPGSRHYPAIEPAPGRYVRVRAM